jgi:hypothetical protein
LEEREGVESNNVNDGIAIQTLAKESSPHMPRRDDFPGRRAEGIAAAVVNRRTPKRTSDTAVFQTGKAHLAYIFDRITGEPIFRMEEQPEKGAGPGTTGWAADANYPDRMATQPIPLKPPPTGRMCLLRNDLNKLTPEIEKYCSDFWDVNHIEDSSPFQQSTPEHPVVQFTVAPTGGWSPPSYNPQLGLVFVSVVHLATLRGTRFRRRR